ncbi:MAG TPA: hypothetical protein DIT07_15225 [Sphingobacteriaceae bacterium]|nr:hypothetical protein [Sphingobacteriaceae bacterium]
MADKDLLVVISEMLRKQDQQTEILRETNSTLTQFMGVSVKQFEQQHKFNEQQQEFNRQQQEFNKQQQEFNTKFLEQNHKIVDRLDSIEEKLVHVVDMTDRIKRLENAVFK